MQLFKAMETRTQSLGVLCVGSLFLVYVRSETPREMLRPITWNTSFTRSRSCAPDTVLITSEPLCTNPQNQDKGKGRETLNEVNISTKKNISPFGKIRNFPRKSECCRLFFACPHLTRLLKAVSENINNPLRVLLYPQEVRITRS